MNTKKHALSLFTKKPQPGTTKTRLTVKHGGSLSDEEAADFYRATVLDVATAALEALRLCQQKPPDNLGNSTYELCISCSSDNDRQGLQGLFDCSFSEALNAKYIVDHGENFDQHFNSHYHQLFDQGYYSVICIGGDLPTISPGFIYGAFEKLSFLEKETGKGAMVIAPCQAAGVSLVGLTRDAPMDFSGVFYNMDGVPALDAITKIASERQIPMALLGTQADVDNMEDMGHAIALIQAMHYASGFSPDSYFPEHTLSWINKIGLVVSTPPNKNHDPRGDIDG